MKTAHYVLLFLVLLAGVILREEPEIAVVGEIPGKGKKGQAHPEMNVTPLVDVVLVLLIIFMVIMPLMPASSTIF